MRQKGNAIPYLKLIYACKAGRPRTNKTAHGDDTIKPRIMFVKRSELLRVEKYMRDKFGNATITLADQADGSCEVNLDGEFIGVIFRDDEDDEVSYDFHMAILDIDLAPVEGIPVPR
jgi:hypothetical protein